MFRRVTFCFAILVASAAFGGFASNEVYIASVGRATGSFSTQFYTTVWLTNLATSGTVHFTFTFLKDGQPNLVGAPFFSDTLAPGQTRMYENVIENMLSISSGLGAARVTADGDIFVSARVYNQAHPSDNLGTTEGLFFTGVPKSFAIGNGEFTSIQGINQGNSSENMRYNFDLVETTGHTCSVHVVLLDASGTAQGSTDVSMDEYGHKKLNVQALLSSVNTINGRIVATVTSGSGKVILAGEQLANTSSDSSGFEMSFKDTLLGSSGVTSLNGLTGDITIAHGANTTVNVSDHTITIDAVSGSGSGLSAVAHDGTLSGSGTVGVPLGVAIPLSFTSGSTVGTIGASPVGLYAKTTDTSGSGVGVWGEGRVFGVYGNVDDGTGTQQAWGEVGRFFNSHYIGLLAYTLDATSGATSIWGTQGLGGSGETPAFPLGVWGDSHDAVGVFGSSAGTTEHGYRYGVLGHGVLGVEGVGTVAGPSNGQMISYGVEGDSYLTGDLRIGVFGYASGGTTNYAGYFFGDVDVIGSVSKSGGSFKIDDPLDPANKYLYHSFVESPDMMNVYNGEVTLDPSGAATVTMPEWFEALNQEFRYQLTAIGTPQPGLFIAKKVAGNAFTIAGGAPGAEVSWQVTGIRHDAWANAHRIPVEVAKPGAEKGTYLAPVELGKSAETGLGFRRSIRPKTGEAPQ